MQTALALSGGGYRASVFHLGVLARLAREDQLENVTFLSTVSGGSLVTGLVFALNGNAWPTSRQYLEKVLPAARKIFTTTDMQKSLLQSVSQNLFLLFGNRAQALSRLIQEKWGVTASLKQLPQSPRWMINATCYETGKNWRFEQFRMGDYLFGYSNDTDRVKIADAMAASAGFPGLIGALELDVAPMKWFEYVTSVNAGDEVGDSPDKIQARKTQPKTRLISDKVHLWDGGVYDNHGLEGLHDFRTGWSGKFEFLLVSDAAGRGGIEQYAPGARAIGRLMTGIMMNQVRSLRTRSILERIQSHDDRGVFLQTGKSVKYILNNIQRTKDNGAYIDEVLKQPGFIDQASQGTLDQAQAEQVANFATVIRQLKEAEFQLIYQHGFETANAVLSSYYPGSFKFIRT
jgi:NTE family protein